MNNIHFINHILKLFFDTNGGNINFRKMNVKYTTFMSTMLDHLSFDDKKTIFFFNELTSK